MNLFMTYDNQGFEQAVKESDSSPFLPEEYRSVLSQLIAWAIHDYTKGFCDSFQIYNEQKEIVFEMSRPKQKGDVA